MTPVVALLGSPLLGPAAWQPVAAELRARGPDVEVPGAPATSRTPQDVLDAYLIGLPADRDLLLVAHSNAGLYVPALIGQRSVVGYVLVDARLPPRSGPIPMARPGTLDNLAAMADDDGLLPPWTRWWPEADGDGLFPSAESRLRIEREQPRLPLSYFRSALIAPDGWDDGPGAYLAFSDAYAPDRDEAARRGWTVATRPGGHLHLLVDPTGVADEIDRLLAVRGYPMGG
jgi:hypothetical protein